MSLFCCPLCGGPLRREERTYRCPAGHSFDRAREGYVHLLPANRKHSRDPGDDREMAAARHRFLSGGWYEPLRAALQELALTCPGPEPAVLDAGCGEGWYTAGVWEALTAAGRRPALAGVDLSRHALRRAARAVPEGEFAVASVYHLPVGAQSCDLVLDCFSPLALEEFRRVLRPGGIFLYVVPAARHLWELKEVLYEHPYLNREENLPYEGFTYLDVVSAGGRMELTRREDIQDLFRMTPYFWKTPKAGGERLRALEALTVTADFRIHVFRRTQRR